MSDWSKVVTEPLGLAGFALFLVFGFLSKLKRKDERRWLAPTAAAMGVAALAGGMVLSYFKASQSSAHGASQIQVNQIQQTTTAPDSPVFQGVQGNVTVNNQSSSSNQGSGNND